MSRSKFQITINHSDHDSVLSKENYEKIFAQIAMLQSSGPACISKENDTLKIDYTAVMTRHQFRYKIGTGNDDFIDILDANKGIYAVGSRYWSQTIADQARLFYCNLIHIRPLLDDDLKSIISVFFDMFSKELANLDRMLYRQDIIEQLNLGHEDYLEDLFFLMTYKNGKTEHYYRSHKNILLKDYSDFLLFHYPSFKKEILNKLNIIKFINTLNETKDVD